VKKFLSVSYFLFSLSVILLGQEQSLVLSPHQFDEQQQLQIAKLDGWIFHEGSDNSWSQTDIDLRGWKSLKPTQLTSAFEDKKGRVEGWFRIKFILDAAFDSIPLSLDRNLWAATDIFLDGELIHSFGETGTTKADFEYYNPNHKIPVPLNLQTGREYLLALHLVNYEEILTPGDLKYNEANLANLINLTGPQFTEVEQTYRRSSYIHSTLWIVVSSIFMMLFWMMSLQNPKERIFTLIAYLSVAIFGIAFFKSLINFFELTFTQEKIRYFMYGTVGPFINVMDLIVIEWVVKRKNSRFSKLLMIVLPILSLIAHFFNISVPFGLFNSALMAYFFYLIIDNRKRIIKGDWAVVLAMSFFLISTNFYLVLRKVSMQDFLIYGNLIFSILLLIPLITLLIYVSLRFKEIIQEKINAQAEKNKQLQAINAASAKFVPAPFLNFLGKNNILDAALGDHVEKQVTVLFSDIRDYTSLSEKMTPEENFRFVNAFNRRMGPIIQKHKGFVNQYLGDCIMAIFPENMEETLDAAIGMQNELSGYNQSRIAKSKVPISMGIGLHAGPLIMGIIGDEHRMDAATISDTVNAASRIEGLTKYFGVNILLSGACVEKLPNLEKYNLRFLGLVQVKGKEKAVKIYECFDGDTEEMIFLKKETLADFKQGMELYFSKNFGESESIFREILSTNPTDATAHLFLEKAMDNKLYGVDAEWTGLEQMLDK